MQEQAENSTIALTPKEERFVSEYLVDFNGAQAAIRAGYTPKSAAVTASQLLRKPNVKAAAALKRAALLKETDLTAARTLEEIRRLAFSDIRQLFDERGNLKPIHLLTAEQAACIASVEVVIKNAAAGDGHTDTVHKIKHWDKTRNLEMLAKHYGLLEEKLSVHGELVMRWQTDTDA